MSNKICNFSAIWPPKNIQKSLNTPVSSLSEYVRVKPHKIADVHNKTEAQKTDVATNYITRMPGKEKGSKHSMLWGTAPLYAPAEIILILSEIYQKAHFWNEKR